MVEKRYSRKRNNIYRVYLIPIYRDANIITNVTSDLLTGAVYFKAVFVLFAGCRTELQ